MNAVRLDCSLVVWYKKESIVTDSIHSRLKMFGQISFAFCCLLVAVVFSTEQVEKQNAAEYDAMMYAREADASNPMYFNQALSSMYARKDDEPNPMYANQQDPAQSSMYARKNEESNPMYAQQRNQEAMYSSRQGEAAADSMYANQDEAQKSMYARNEVAAEGIPTARQLLAFQRTITTFQIITT